MIGFLFRMFFGKRARRSLKRGYRLGSKLGRR